MVVLLIILSVLLFLIIWILFLPYIIVINSEQNKYRIFLPGLFGFRIVKENDKWKPEMNIFFFRFNPIEKRKQDVKKQKKEKNKGKKVKFSQVPSMIKKGTDIFLKIIRSHKVRRFHTEIDTGDFVLNAQLFPVVNLIGLNHNQVRINFENRNSIDLRITGQLIYIAYYGLKFYISNKLFTKN